MRVGIVGGGVVGSATARCFLEHVEEVRVYDIAKERRTHDVYETRRCDIVFVCLPTPQKAGSLECDTSVVEGFFADAASHGKDSIGRNAKYVLRSTVPIGTTRRLSDKYGLPNLVHSPEFLTARCAFADAQIPARNVIGAHWWAHGGGIGECFADLRELYRTRFPAVPIHVMTSDESEAVKLFQNSFFAVKVAYWNEVRTLADRLDLHWDRVLNAILADGRISPSHTKVPGPDRRFGFGGTCLPKDLASLIWQLGEAGMVCNAALRRNEVIDRKRRTQQ